MGTLNLLPDFGFGRPLFANMCLLTHFEPENQGFCWQGLNTFASCLVTQCRSQEDKKKLLLLSRVVAK